MRLALASALLMWAGVTLCASTTKWFSRRPLAERLRPYNAGAVSSSTALGLLSVESFREVIGPVCRSAGAAVGRLFGVSEDLGRRLARTHSPLDVTTFRVRQVGWAVGAFGTGALVAFMLQLPDTIAALMLLGGPILAFLVIEQSVSKASADWQHRLFLELPVVSEQLGMLLAAGYSLSGALNRISERSNGCCGRDLQRVTGRTRQGVTAVVALQEWAQLADVPAVSRLVQILSLNREAGDLGRLISEEARSIRRDVQRQTIERMERREQQVWIPVTVATLIPGVIFLAVPFTQAMRLFAGS